MRIDVRTDKPPAYGAKVFLDGESVRECVMADDEEGIVEAYITDEYGRVGYPARTRIKHGAVRIELPESYAR